VDGGIHRNKQEFVGGQKIQESIMFDIKIIAQDLDAHPALD